MHRDVVAVVRRLVTSRLDDAMRIPADDTSTFGRVDSVHENRVGRRCKLAGRVSRVARNVVVSLTSIGPRVSFRESLPFPLSSLSFSKRGQRKLRSNSSLLASRLLADRCHTAAAAVAPPLALSRSLSPSRDSSLLRLTIRLSVSLDLVALSHHHHHVYSFSTPHETPATERRSNVKVGDC